MQNLMLAAVIFGLGFVVLAIVIAANKREVDLDLDPYAAEGYDDEAVDESA